MKKIIIIIIILLAGCAAYFYRGQIINLFQPAGRLQSLSRNFQQNSAVLDIQKQIFTPGPLRGTEDSAQSNLTRAGVIEFTNVQRAENGKSELKENVLLDNAAQLKLEDMFARQYFEHISPQGKGPGDLANAVNYDYIVIGENLALGNFKDDQALVAAWMASPGHRANILNSQFQEIGVAVGKGLYQGKSTWLAVQEFGKPAGSCPSVDLGLKQQIKDGQTEADQLAAQLQSTKAYLDAQEPQSQEQYQAYNQQVAVYNSQVAIYNNKIDVLKQTAEAYNAQVQAYNACAAQ